MSTPTTPSGNCSETDWTRDRLGYGYRTLPGIGRKTAHRWAWEQAHGPIPDGLFVMHLCDNPPCVNVEHLRLGTHADNMADMRSKGRHAHGETSGRAILTEETVRSIREMGKTLTGTEIAARLGVSPSTARRALNGLNWRDVDPGSAPGKAKPRAKLTPEKVREIRALWQEGLTLYAIAERFGVWHGTISHVLRGRTWSHVEGASMRSSLRAETPE